MWRRSANSYKVCRSAVRRTCGAPDVDIPAYRENGASWGPVPGCSRYPARDAQIGSGVQLARRVSYRYRVGVSPTYLRNC